MSKHYTKHYLTWIKDAKCAEDPESVKDAYGDDQDPDEVSTAQAEHFAQYFCLQCPVLLECLAHAVRKDESQGVWGSFLPSEREGMKLGEGVLKDFE